MQLTNKYNLPAPLKSALRRDLYHHPGHISVTGLIQPPQLRQLSIRYDDQIVEDVSDRIWMLLGNAVHDVLERADTTNSLQEERLETEVMGWKITGKADLWDDNTVSDYKITSVWAGINGVKPEWEAQLNMYGLLYEQNTFTVDALQIVAIYRDWSKGKAKQGGDYPAVPAQVLPVERWPVDDAELFLQTRVQVHKDAEDLEDEELPECTAEERWEKPTTYAVMKEGRKSAVRVFDTEKQVQDYIMDYGGAKNYIETRPGRSVRCEEYCPVRDFCHQYARMQNSQ